MQSDQEKAALRIKYRNIRKNISEHKRKLLSREICRNFYANIKIPKNAVVAGYIANEDEVDISLLMEMYADDGHKLCLPAVVEDKAPMVFRSYAKGVGLSKNKNYGFLEPPYTMPEILPYLIITPMVAFDAARNRLGQGGGFYDRSFDYLSQITDFLAVGVAFSAQQAPFTHPTAKDYLLDAIVTEEKIFT